MKISGLILTKNEEENISDCINSLSFCDEIIVVDDYSTDNTVKIAKRLGAKVYMREMNKNYSDQSNFALSKASYDWTLMIDADERVGSKLKREILTTDPKFSSYRIPRKDYLLGKLLKNGETGDAYVTRFINKSKAKWTRRVHPKLEVKGDIGCLENPILHHPHESVSDFLESINRWSSWHALSLSDEGKSAYFLKTLIWPFGKFISNFLIKKGFMDGTYGFVHAVFMSFHSFLAWSQLWLKEKKS